LASHTALLENCKNTYEAVNLLQEMPYAKGNNLIISDKGNHAALVELWNKEKAVRWINSNTDGQFLSSTNHYLLENMSYYNSYYDQNFLLDCEERLLAMDSVLCEERGRINKETIRRILSTACPVGVCCCREYNKGYGTIWSMIFDVTNTTTEICFGPPSHNKWIETDLWQLVGSRVYTADFPVE
jgi:predicted choloylglycine hydrolase